MLVVFHINVLRTQYLNIINRLICSFVSLKKSYLEENFTGSPEITGFDAMLVKQRGQTTNSISYLTFFD